MVMPLRVLLLTETFHPEIGGGERQAEVLSRALARRGHAVTIVTRRSRADLPGSAEHLGVPVLRVGPAGRGQWKKWALAVAAAGPLMRMRREFDVVLVSGYRILGIPAVAASRAFRRACVLKADSTGELSGEFFRAGLARLRLTPESASVRLLVRMRNALLRRADAFVAISAAIGEELKIGGVPAPRVHYVPNGVDVTTFRPADAAERAALRARLRLPDGPLAVYTGRLVSYKGLPLLMRVWCDLRRSGQLGTLVLVGTGSGDMHNCEADLHEYVRRHHLHDSVVFTGAVSNVQDYLRASDVFVYPTEDEAFGLSLVEAMACGLAVVGTRVGGIPDFLVDGENGLMVSAGSFSELRDAIATLLAGGGRTAALARAARDTAVSRFSEDAVAEEYLRVFESV